MFDDLLAEWYGSYRLNGNHGGFAMTTKPVGSAETYLGPFALSLSSRVRLVERAMKVAKVEDDFILNFTRNKLYGEWMVHLREATRHFGSDELETAVTNLATRIAMFTPKFFDFEEEDGSSVAFDGAR